MKLIKKIISVLILTMALFVGVSSIKDTTSMAKAATYTLPTITGVGVRLSGFAGIRYEVTLENYEDKATLIDKVGVVIAYGYVGNNDFAIQLDTTINGYETIYGEVDLSDVVNDKYYITLYNVPETCYAQTVTAVAYIRYKDKSITYHGDIYDDNAYTSLIDVTLKALNDNQTGEFLTTVKDYVEDNYKVYFKDNDYSINLYSPIYETNNYLIYIKFIEAWNSYVSDSDKITDQIGSLNRANELRSKMYSNFFMDEDDGGAIASFFRNNPEWHWLVDFAENEPYTDNHLAYQAAYLRGETDIQSDTSYRECRLIVNRLIAFFTGKYIECAGITANDLADFRMSVSQYNNVIYRNVRSDTYYYKIGSTCYLPNLKYLAGNPKKYCLNGQTYSSNSYTVTDEDVVFSVQTTEVNDSSNYTLITTDTTIGGSDSSNKETISNTKYMISGNELGTITFQNITFSGACEIRNAINTSSYVVNNLIFDNCHFSSSDISRSFIKLINGDGVVANNITFKNCDLNAYSTSLEEGLICITNCVNLTIENTSIVNSFSNSISLLKSENGAGLSGNILVKTTNSSDSSALTGINSIYVEYYNNKNSNTIAFDGVKVYTGGMASLTIKDLYNANNANISLTNIQPYGAFYVSIPKSIPSITLNGSIVTNNWYIN